MASKHPSHNRRTLAGYPMNWPLGDGPRFRGFMDRRGGGLHLFERTPHGAFRAPVELMNLRDPRVREHVAGRFVIDSEPPATDIPAGGALARDPSGRWALLAEGEWVLRALAHYQPDWHPTTSPDAPEASEPAYPS